MIEVDTQVGEDAAVIRPRGRLTMVVTPQLRTLINETVQAGRARIVVDLADCEFVDSSGLGALIAGLKTARQAGGDLRIARSRPADRHRPVTDQPRPHPSTARHRRRGARCRVTRCREAHHPSTA